MKCYFEKFSSNVFLLKDEATKSILKPMSKKQALKTAEATITKSKSKKTTNSNSLNPESILNDNNTFIYTPSKRTKAGEEKHQNKLEEQYATIIPFYDKNRTVKSAIAVSGIHSKHLGVKTHKKTTKKAADNTSFKTYEELENPEYQYILIGNFLGRKVELKVSSNIFYDNPAPLNEVFKVNAL